MDPVYVGVYVCVCVCVCMCVCVYVCVCVFVQIILLCLTNYCVRQKRASQALATVITLGKSVGYRIICIQTVVSFKNS